MGTKTTHCCSRAACFSYLRLDVEQVEERYVLHVWNYKISRQISNIVSHYRDKKENKKKDIWRK